MHRWKMPGVVVALCSERGEYSEDGDNVSRAIMTVNGWLWGCDFSLGPQVLVDSCRHFNFFVVLRSER